MLDIGVRRLDLRLRLCREWRRGLPDVDDEYLRGLLPLLLSGLSSKLWRRQGQRAVVVDCVDLVILMLRRLEDCLGRGLGDLVW